MTAFRDRTRGNRTHQRHERRDEHDDADGERIGHLQDERAEENPDRIDECHYDLYAHIVTGGNPGALARTVDRGTGARRQKRDDEQPNSPTIRQIKDDGK